jgi:putative DNA primase/helicase
MQDAITPVAANLQPLAATVRILELPGLPPKGDVSDWLAAGGTREELQKLTAEAPLFSIGAEDVAETDGAIPPEFSDDALALQFADKHSAELRYVASLGKWHIWAGSRWRPDDTLQAFDLVRDICRTASARIPPKQERLAFTVASARIVAAVERLARADRRHASAADQWDFDPWIFNPAKKETR